MNHAGQVDTTYLQVGCTKKLLNPRRGTRKTKENLSFCQAWSRCQHRLLPRVGVAGQQENLLYLSWVNPRRMCELAVLSPLFCPLPPSDQPTAFFLQKSLRKGIVSLLAVNDNDSCETRPMGWKGYGFNLFVALYSKLFVPTGFAISGYPSQLVETKWG